MRALALVLAALVCQPSMAIGPYKCRPAQMFDGGTSVATVSIGKVSSCAVWMCGGIPQVSAVKTEALTDSMRADWASLLLSNSGSPLNAMRDKYAKDDVCTTLWDAWASCRVGLTQAQVKAICPAR